MKKFLCYLSIIFAITSCAISEKPALEVVDEEQTELPALPPEFIVAFKSSSNESCIANGNDIDECSCYTDEILNTFTIDDFSKVFELNYEKKNSEIISDPDVGPKIINASIKCFS